MNPDRIIYDVHYFNICKEHLLAFDRLDEELSGIWRELDRRKEQIEGFEETEALINKAAQVRTERDQSGHIVIVFAAMCLEALIYDFGAVRSSDTYFKKYLDKLDPKAKWVVVPKLVTGQEFNTSSQTFELLGGLFKKRNDLVHFKSSYAPEEESIFSSGEDYQEDQEFPQSVRDAIRAVFKATAELKRIAPDWINYSWYSPRNSVNEAVKQYA